MPDPLLDGTAGMRCELLMERETRCRRAKSARNYGLRREVYTLRPGALSTALAGRFAGVAVNFRGAMGGDDPGRDAGLRSPGQRRCGPPAVAATAAACGAARLRRPVAGLEPRPSRGRPGGQPGPAGLRRGRRDGG